MNCPNSRVVAITIAAISASAQRSREPAALQGRPPMARINASFSAAEVSRCHISN